MKVAFDVQGTLEGPYSDKVVDLFNVFQEKGHEVYIWSFGGSGMARDAANDKQLKPVGCISKRTKEYGEEPQFDICIDDDRRTAEGLDAKRVIYVNQIPDKDDSDRWNRFLTHFGLN